MEHQKFNDLESFLSSLQKMNDPRIDIAGSFGRYLENRAREKGIPLHGTFELTPFCNFDCKMCYVHLNKDQLKGKKVLTTEQWKLLIDQAVDAGMINATLTGGECLVYPGFDEVYLHLQSLGIRTTILTNGLLLDEERIEFFKSYPPKGIQISVYGSSEDEYEAVTGYRGFEKVTNNIDCLGQTKIPMMIAITPNRFMLDGGKSLVRFVNNLGIHYSVNTALLTPREETGKSKSMIDIDDDEYIKLHKLCRELKGNKVSSIVECDLPSPQIKGTPQKGLLCSGGKSGFHITWDGRMLPCSSFLEGDTFPLESGFWDAWQKLNTFAKEYPLPEECGECIYNSICPACVMVHRRDSLPGHASKRVCARAQKLVLSGLASLK